MKEPIIWEISVPEITVEDLLMAQGGKDVKRSPRPAMLEVNRRMLEEAQVLARPTIIWTEAGISGVEENSLVLEEGPALKSKLLARVAGTADKLILYAMTIGGALEERIAEYNKAGKMLEAFTLDAAGSIFLAKSSTLAVEKIQSEYRSEGMSFTFPLGPGHSYWNGLEDLRNIVNFVQGERIGITLTDSNLMLPRKSLAFVMGVGNNLPDFKGKTHCDFCSQQKNCNMKKIGDKC